MPRDTFGFIYQVTYLPTNEKYLGKKFIYFSKKLPPLKDLNVKEKYPLKVIGKNIMVVMIKLKLY